MQKFLLYVLLFVIILFCVGWYFSDITLYFIFSMVIAAALRPFTNRVNNFHILGQNLPRSIAIVLSFLLIALLVFFVGLLFIPLFRTQFEVIQALDLDYLYDKVQGPVGYIEDLLIKFNLTDNQPGYLISNLRQSLSRSFNEINIQGFLNLFINTTSSVVISSMAIIFITYFLLLENGLLRRNLMNFIPNSYFELSVATFHKVERLLSNYLVGLFVQMSAIFTIASLGLIIMDINYAVTIAIFAAIANLIPYIGPVLGACFGVLVGLSTSTFMDTNEMYFFIFKVLSVFAVVQITDNILLQPVIFSKSVKVHPLEIFVVIFAGAKIAGILGMVFAIPVYTIFRVSLVEFHRGYKEYRIFKINKI
jgi:predicted PurR-regulated permease PerM